MDRTIIRITGAAVVALLALGATSLAPGARIAISVVVGLPSLVLMIISRRQLGKSFSVMPAAKALVTTGLYSRIQHPMYVFLDLILVALIVVLNLPTLLWVWGIVVVVQALQSRREEKVLQAAFGSDYDAYRNRTWF